MGCRRDGRKGPKRDLGHRWGLPVLATSTLENWDATMKNIALVFALAFAFTTVMVVTVVAHTNRAMADSAGTVIVYPEQASQCEGTNC
jgi:hypothetical protein